ncbi:MAG: hypothetical protein QNK20_11070 [Aureibaculum sp.]|nr:hypothetical protein [Aureibaculum sp.]
MNLKNTLHYASYMKWAFLLAAIILIFYSLIVLPENLISIIGIIVFLVGIHMGLDSLSDMEKMSEKEKNFYRNIKYVKNQRIIVLSSIVVLVIISLLFLSLKFIFPSKPLFNDFFDLGLDCWAMILGLLCLLKSIYDKNEFVKSQLI